MGSQFNDGCSTWLGFTIPFVVFFFSASVFVFLQPTDVRVCPTMQSLSWKRYDDQYHLSELLTEAARACVEARASYPAAFLASYFTKVTSGDHVDTIHCTRFFTPSGDVGLTMHIRLFTNATASSTAVFSSERISSDRNSKPLGGTIGGSTSSAPSSSGGSGGGIHFNSQPVLRLQEFTVDHLIPELRLIGVYQQTKWDKVIDEAVWEGLHPFDTQTFLPSEACYSFSMAASIVAAKSGKMPLYSHFSSLYHTQRPATQLGSKPHQSHKHTALDTHRAMPLLLLPLFGHGDPSASPVGSVYFRTLYLIPLTSALGSTAKESESGLVEDASRTRALMTEEMLERLIVAYSLLNEKLNHPPLRSDGGFTYTSFENLSDAVTMVVDVMATVGLRAGSDFCFGVRVDCPVTRHSPEAIAASMAPAGKGKRPPKDQGKLEAVMYNLFPGDPEVTGAQVTEYMMDQVQACNGLLVFLEDTHDANNAAGVQRLMTRLGGDGGVMISSCSGLLSSPQSRESLVETVEEGIKSLLSQNFSLPVRLVGSMTRLMGIGKLLEVNHRCVTLVASSNDSDVAHLIDLAVGISAKYVCVGGLMSPTACSALSHYIEVQSSLLEQRALEDPLPPCITFAADLPPLSEELVPEIKRRNEKKKKKPAPGKH